MRMQTAIFYLVWGQNAHFIFHKQSPQESDVERIDFFFFSLWAFLVPLRVRGLVNIMFSIFCH